MGQENIVRYWHAVELLQPQSAPQLKKRSSSYSAFIHDTPIQHPVPPWAPESVVGKQVLPKKRVWSHTLYAHLYESRLVAEKLKEAFGADQGYREPQYRESALFAAKFTMAGQMVDNSFVLSSEAWFLGRVLTGKDWTRGFEDDQKNAGNQAKALLNGHVSGDALRELTQWVLKFLGVADFLGHMDRHRFRFRSQPVKPDKPESEDDPLNSFFLDDLADVADSISQGVKSEPLDQYLRQYDPLRRLHVDDDRASLPLIERLMPDAYANSCWPSERHLGLVHSQQLAVNTILSTLADGQGLLGINGPPGTGKTTLLRDLIAAIVTSRADALAKLRRASDGFASSGREEANDGGKPQAWLNAHAKTNATRSSEQRQALWQQAVSDYKAVKEEARKACADAGRIRELIQSICQTRKKIADKSETLGALEQKLADAVAQLAHLDAKESRLANLALKQCLDALKQHRASKPGFWAKLFSLWKAQRDWNATQELLESERDIASAEFARIARLTRQLDMSRESLEKQTAEARRALLQLQGQEKVLARDATGLASACQADHLVAWLQGGTIGRGDAIELAEPWRIEGWRQARARVFIQALKLHRTFFELEASRMRSNLFLINGLLTGSRFQGLSRDAIRSAWASLFMVVPVLSSTFASFARSFGSLGASEIGWLLVDEAGQAPPQAAVGALWRSRRALLVGDPLQLKPIVTVSDAVLEHMRTRYRVDAHWLPNRQSAQTLADQATPWGRMAGPADSKTWVGLLDAWAKQLATQRAPMLRRYFVPGLKSDALIGRLGQLFDAHQVAYTVSYEAAAQRYAPFLSGISQVRVRLLPSTSAETAMAELGARVVNEGANLAVIEMKSAGELLFRQNVGGVWLASPVQVYLDLLRGEGRAKEMAEHLRKERIGF